LGYAREEAVGSTGVATSFLPTFFEMSDSTCVAFFEIEGVGSTTTSPRCRAGRRTSCSP